MTMTHYSQLIQGRMEFGWRVWGLECAGAVLQENNLDNLFRRFACHKVQADHRIELFLYQAEKVLSLTLTQWPSQAWVKVSRAKLLATERSQRKPREMQKKSKVVVVGGFWFWTTPSKQERSGLCTLSPWIVTTHLNAPRQSVPSLCMSQGAGGPSHRIFSLPGWKGAKSDLDSVTQPGLG